MASAVSTAELVSRSRNMPNSSGGEDWKMQHARSENRSNPLLDLIQHPPHTGERVGDCIEASGCELFSAARHPAITLSKAQTQQDRPCLRGPWSKDRDPPHLEKAQGTRLGCSSIAHGPRDPRGPHQCPWPIAHAHGSLGQFQRSRFRAESPNTKFPAASGSGRRPMAHGPISSHRRGVAVAGTRAEPGREHLAKYAGQLGLEPGLRPL